MPYTFDNVLDHDLITVLERDDCLGNFVIRLGDLETPITIKFCRLISSEETIFEVSHAIHTPVQIDAYWTSRPSANSPAYALHRAVNGLTSYYQDAVNAGHEPCEDWLVQATTYRT